ncbi:MAG: cation transporter [Bryobacter sp.]|nr:cation transporter [Bryobacter sp.]
MLRQAEQLQYFTIAYNGAEAVVALANAQQTESLALFSFGLDSVIEFSASLVALGLLKQLWSERMAGRAIAVSLFLLAAWTAYEAIERIASQEAARTNWITLAIAAASVVVMPWLAATKRQVARQLGSRALEGEVAQTDFCFYLSVILLASSLAQWMLGWTQVDAVGALLMTPFLWGEARRAWKGEACGSCGSCH